MNEPKVKFGRCTSLVDRKNLATTTKVSPRSGKLPRINGHKLPPLPSLPVFSLYLRPLRKVWRCIPACVPCTEGLLSPGSLNSPEEFPERC